jgi:hypothetical protein
MLGPNNIVSLVVVGEAKKIERTTLFVVLHFGLGIKLAVSRENDN